MILWFESSLKLLGRTRFFSHVLSRFKIVCLNSHEHELLSVNHIKNPGNIHHHLKWAVTCYTTSSNHAWPHVPHPKNGTQEETFRRSRAESRRKSSNIFDKHHNQIKSHYRKHITQRNSQQKKTTLQGDSCFSSESNLGCAERDGGKSL